MRDLIKKIQELPEFKRKIILWSIIVILGLGLFSLYFKNIQRKLSSFEGEELKEELKLPALEEELKKLPKIETPKIEVPEIKEGELKK